MSEVLYWNYWNIGNISRTFCSISEHWNIVFFMSQARHEHTRTPHRHAPRKAHTRIYDGFSFTLLEMTKLAISVRYLQDLERHISTIQHCLQFDLFGEGKQDAYNTASDIRSSLYFILKHPELYLLHDPNIHTRSPSVRITRRLRRRINDNTSKSIDGVNTVTNIGL